MKMDVAVIMINYNNAQYTLDCLASIQSKTDSDLNYEVIVVDNNSEIKDYFFLKENFPDLPNFRLKRSVINTGFGGGNMFGAQFANASYLLFLNNDILLKNDCLSTLKSYMDGNLDVGVCTAQNYDEYDNFTISFDHDKGLRKLIFGRSFLEKTNPEQFPKRKTKYTQPVKVNFVNGACMFFRTSAFEKVGGFDTAIFLYFEEMDICHRLRKYQFSSVLCPDAELTHFIGATTGTSKRITEEAFRSYLYVVKKNYSLYKYALIKFYYIITFAIKPKKWYLYPVILRNGDWKNSMRLHQKLRYVKPL